MIICLSIIIITGTLIITNPIFESVTFVFGIAAGWALRETLEEIRKEE